MNLYKHQFETAICVIDEREIMLTRTTN